ncbi:MAG: PHP domain-containing protein [Clostridiales bacterium]|nr:PHP domain-containing protein [Clostridiales bacterium]
MTSKYDLHIHSSFSDGTDSPKEILTKAKALGIENVAITDHDTIRGLKEEKENAKALGINYVNGVELSTFSLMEVHILGYAFDADDDRLNTTLNDFSEQRKTRVRKILDLLAKQKIYIDEEDLVDSDSIGRLHVANALVKKGYVGSIPEAFDRYLGAKGCAYLPSKRITPFEGVEIIKAAKGIPVIAHPLRFHQAKILNDLIEGLKAHGLGGLEVYYNTHDEQTRKELYSLAQKHKLIATGGTDYHGKNRNLELGSVIWEPDKYTKAKLHLN